MQTTFFQVVGAVALIDRRQLLTGSGSLALTGSTLIARRVAAQARSGFLQVSVRQFGGVSDSGRDDTQAVQRAIDAVQRSGGGIVHIDGRYRCGNLTISGHDVRLLGERGWIVDGRLTIAAEARRIEVSNLGLLDTTGDRRTFLIDVSGQDCRFTNIELVKNPIAGGYQMYIRQQAVACRFDGLRLKGSNGVMVAGREHRFENFELESPLSERLGGDDAFAIKAVEDTTGDIVIRNGVVRGFSAIVSFGSEIGSAEGRAGGGAVRNITVENVTADRCGAVAFFKPDALDFDWRNGLVEQVVLRNLTLSDPRGDRFRSGIRMIAARGATIRNVKAMGIRILARARDRGVAPTAAIDLTLLDRGAPARVEDVRLHLSYADPYAGSPHGPTTPGYPVDHIVRIEKIDARRGSMSDIVLDVEGRGAGWGGIYVGPGLDNAVTIQRAVLTRVATNPPASVAGGGIWSESRVSLGRVTIDSVKLPQFGGRAFRTNGG